MHKICIHSLCLKMLIILSCFATNNAVESDISCLRSIKETLEDPKNALSNWDFSNRTEGSICRFTGIECWHPDESRVLNIRLADMGLRGPFPTGLTNCISLTGLDLSGNYLLGPLPSNFPDGLAYIISLDLSSNNFSGPIPPSIVKCTFIIDLRLNDNQLTGHIPENLSELWCLKEFSVANNRLSGPVPIFTYSIFSVESYANNPGLCGTPLSPCKHEDILDAFFFSGFAVGFPLSTILTMWLVYYCLHRPSISNMGFYLLMIKNIKGRNRHLIPTRSPQILAATEITNEENKVIVMEKFTRRLSLEELVTATNDFDSRKVIGYGNMGLMYKAFFPNGFALAVKRLHNFQSLEKEFLLEIEILGRLKHPNLVPLLGFCFEMKKLLVYKYMSNGTLHQWLHSRPQVEGEKMKWTLRLKIAVGIARGLTWLHQNNVAHLKIKSNCILLDDKFEPKISNFGNSNILTNTSGTSSTRGTFFVPHSSSSPYKEDVYRFGILLLELISGREPSKWIDSPTDHVCGEESKVIDECLIGQGFDEEIHEMLRIAENCVRAHKSGKTSMLQVFQAIRVIGISRSEIPVNSHMNVEDIK